LVEAVCQSAEEVRQRVKILLDTNALIWWLSDDPRLGARAKQIIAKEDTEILVSVVSLWEITMKNRVGKMTYVGSDFLADLKDEEIDPLPVSVPHLLKLEELGFHHKDPFDHLILAQAVVEGALVLTSDKEMTLYGVPCIPAVR
jgi:PIN domain nuclease of toxin-antitoxin system